MIAKRPTAPCSCCGYNPYLDPPMRLIANDPVEHKHCPIPNVAEDWTCLCGKVWRRTQSILAGMSVIGFERIA